MTFRYMHVVLNTFLITFTGQKNNYFLTLNFQNLQTPYCAQNVLNTFLFTFTSQKNNYFLTSTFKTIKLLVMLGMFD